jgi:hypothetical protein
MTVDELMKLAFEGSGRTWRSFEYRNGVRAVLQFRYERKTPHLPEQPGTPQCDAFLGGMEEGWLLLMRFATASVPQIAEAELHQWVEESRARVMENLSFGTGRTATGELPLVRALHVIEAVTQRLAARPPRYPWESDHETHGESGVPA